MNSSERDEQPEPVTVVDPAGIECVLAAGDAADVPALREWALGLPESSYGKIFIEVFAPMQIVPLTLPAHVSVTWLCREEREASPRPGMSRGRGAALADAVDAWCDEWLWADCDSVRKIELWTGARTSPIMQNYWTALDRRIEKRWPAGLQQAARALPTPRTHP